MQALLKLKSLTFYLTVFFLPTQLGRHFWPSWSYVSGLRIDYLSPTIYVTDILISVLFILWIISTIKRIKLKFTIYHLPFTFFLLSLLISISLSKNPHAGLYGFLKLFEFAFFGLYTAKTIKGLKDIRIITTLFSIGILFESVLAIAQYLKHASIGGVWYFLGERTFTSQTPGIANASLNGQLILRPYATFPHPNVLAGYLTIALAIVISNIQKYVFFSAFAIGTIALFLTMSRVAIILWVVIVFYFLKPLILNTKYVIPLLLLIVSALLFSPLGFRFLDITTMDESFIRRKELIAVTVEMIKTSPLVGVGLMNFLPNLPVFQTMPIGSLFTTIQPVHNIFFLVTAETGIIGLFFFLWFLFKTFKKVTEKKFSIFNFQFSILAVVLVLGLFDHYFLTLQQGQLLLAFVLGMAWANITFSSSTAVIFMKPAQAKHIVKI